MLVKSKHLCQLLLAAFLAGLSACGGGDSAKLEPITGHWSLTLHPSDTPHTHSQAMTVDKLYLKETDGVLTGHQGPFTLNGTRNGSDLYLDIAHGPATDHAQMTLKLASDGTVAAGSGYTWVPAATAGGDRTKKTYDVRIAKLDALDDIPAQEPMPSGTLSAKGSSVLTSKSWLSDLCDVASTVAATVVGKLSGGMFRPMGGCWGVADGGGYYAFGRDAPGSLLPYWTQNMYLPVEWGYCDTRSYGFTFSYDGETNLVRGLELLGEGMDDQLNAAFPAFANQKALLAAAFDNLMAAYGHFALLVVVHPRTGFAGLYVINEADNRGIENEPVIRDVAGALGLSVLSGRSIHDTFSMARTLVPGACDNLTFLYLVGTAKVNLD
ncbi:MAG TPA: hypothetical protein GYA10_03310 [Alphaproteobacteria bacterium]|nr:hypothetical protein [Alphaproteobacteria bacterium]